MNHTVLSSRVTERTVQVLIGTSRNAYHHNAAISNFEGQADSVTINRDYFIDSERYASHVQDRPKSGHPFILQELLTKRSCHTKFPKQLGIYRYFKGSPQWYFVSTYTA